MSEEATPYWWLETSQVVAVANREQRHALCDEDADMRRRAALFRDRAAGEVVRRLAGGVVVWPACVRNGLVASRSGGIASTG